MYIGWLPLAVYVAFYGVHCNGELTTDLPPFTDIIDNNATDVITGTVTDISLLDDNSTMYRFLGLDNNVTNTSTIAPVTTAAPSSVGGHWSFNYSGSNHFCILMEASSVELHVVYPMKHGNHSIVTLKGPGKDTNVAQSLSVCGPNLTKDELNETLALNMYVTNKNSSLPYKVIVTFYFTRDPVITTDKTLDKSLLYKMKVDYQYRPDIFTDIDPSMIRKTVVDETNHTLHEFLILKDRSYQCKSTSSIKLNNRMTVTFNGIRSQAFMQHDYFAAPEPCPADAQSSDLVPIIIGAVLAAIVLIVLIAYLIGRARARRSTYESI